MWVQVRYFAAVREIIGDSAARWELPEGATVGDLWGRLATANPPLRQLTCTAAVNQEYVSPETALADGDEVVFIPPVSGGAPGPGDGTHLGPLSTWWRGVDSRFRGNDGWGGGNDNLCKGLRR